MEYMLRYLLYFFIGGFVVTAVTALAERGHPLLAGVVAIFPGITLVSFYFIGRAAGDLAVSLTAKSCLLSIFVWIPYALAVIWLSPRLGTNKALLIGVLIYVLLAFALVYANRLTGVVQG
jgi:uncharacterized membrane protein (GlpM family)